MRRTSTSIRTTSARCSGCRGRGWRRSGNSTRRSPASQRVVALEPNDSSAWVNLATLYGGKGDLENSMRSYEKAFTLNLFADTRRVHQPRIRVRAGRNGEDCRSRSGVGPDDEGSGSIRASGPAGFDRSRCWRCTGTIRGGHRTPAPRDGDRSDATEQEVSEYRERLFLVTALDALGRSREGAAESAALDRRIATLTLSPDWLAGPIKMKARRGDARARALAAVHGEDDRTETADAVSARNPGLDRAWVDFAQAHSTWPKGGSFAP